MTCHARISDPSIDDPAGTLAMFADWWEQKPAQALLIVGGGRWARVWMDVAQRSRMLLAPPVVCSPYLAGDADEARLLRNEIEKAGGHVCRSMEEARRLADRLSPAGIAPAAIIANRTRDHVSSAVAAIELGCNVLIEKPVAHTASDLALLDRFITASERVCLPAHVFAFATYLHEFRRDFRDLLDASRSFRLIWEDPAHEIRHGAVKTREPDLTDAFDLWPHVYTILRVAFSRTFRVEAAEADAQGSTIVDVRSGSCIGIVSMNKAGQSRKRLLQISTTYATVELDFTQEPGSLVVNGRTRHFGSLWELYPSPLRVQLGNFLSVCAGESYPRFPMELERNALYEAGKIDLLMSASKRNGTPK